MQSYGESNERRYLYKLDNFDPVVFMPKKSVEKVINIKEIKKYNIKDFKWLNEKKGSELGFFFHRDNVKKEFYIIEKKASNKYLYLRKVNFIEEVE